MFLNPYQLPLNDDIPVRVEAKIKRKGKDWSHYRDRPVDFALEVLGIPYLTPDACLILDSVVRNKVTNVAASHAIGKSFLMGAVLVPYWIYAVGGLCITTAPTERQVKQILWSEIRRSHAKNKRKLGGIGGEMFLRLNEEARAFGFTARSTDSNGFQGVHADYLLLIEDEACGISPQIDEGAESCVAGTNNRLVRVGNPIADGTPFAMACKQSSIRIPAWTHPNVAWAYQRDSDGIHRIKPELRKALLNEDGKPKARENWGEEAIAAMQSYLKQHNAREIKGAISIEWIEDKRAKYHENSAFWESRVEARFPLDSGQSVIPRRYFLMGRIKYDNDYARLHMQNKHLPQRYGVDVGDGGDPHAIARWQGSLLLGVKQHPTLGDELDTKRAANLLIREVENHGAGFVAVDNVGVGAGTLAIIKDEIPASGIRWGETAGDSKKFANLKAEQYWLVREGLESGELAIAPLGEYEEMLQEDWANTFYETTVKDQVKIEDKRKTIARLGRSPNCGDAAIYAYHASPSINPLLLS